MNVWERFAQARVDVIDALHANGVNPKEIADGFAWSEEQVRVVLNRDRSKDFATAEAQAADVGELREALEAIADGEGDAQVIAQQTLAALKGKKP